MAAIDDVKTFLALWLKKHPEGGEILRVNEAPLHSDALRETLSRADTMRAMLEKQAEHRIKEALEPKPKGKRESNPARWSRLASEAEAKANELKEILEELEGMRSECEEKRDAMNDGLQQTPYGQKLSEIADLDISTHVDNAEEAASAASDAGGMDWPRGFGRD